MSHLGEFIKLGRERKHITQKQLALHLGYRTPQYISEIECGNCYFPAGKAKKMCEFLDLNFDELLDKFAQDKKEEYLSSSI